MENVYIDLKYNEFSYKCKNLVLNFLKLYYFKISYKIRNHFLFNLMNDMNYNDNCNSLGLSKKFIHCKITNVFVGYKDNMFIIRFHYMKNHEIKLPIEEIELDKLHLYFRYLLLSSIKTGQSIIKTSVLVGFHPDIYNNIKKIYNNSVECFASYFNHTLETYFSIFEEDKEYGSLGSFFNNFLKSKYGCYILSPNPSDYLYTKCVNIVIKKLKENKKVNIIILMNYYKDIIDILIDGLNKLNVRFDFNIMDNTKFYNYLTKEIVISKPKNIIIFINDTIELKKDIMKYLV